MFDFEISKGWFIMPAWEYKTVVRTQDEQMTDEEMNKLGAAGMELVAVVTTAEEEVIVGRKEQKNRFYYYFKSPKQ